MHNVKDRRVLIRRERPQDALRIRAVVASAFAGRAPNDGVPVEVGLLDDLRSDAGWLPLLSLVAIDPRDNFAADDADDDASRSDPDDDMVVGYVTCTRAYVDGQPGLGLGPLAVRPERQRQGVGEALMHAVLGMADGLGEPYVGLLGDPAYYRRFGFHPAARFGIEAPDPSWGSYFQIRALAAFAPVKGTFQYAPPFALR